MVPDTCIGLPSDDQSDVSPLCINHPVMPCTILLETITDLSNFNHNAPYLLLAILLYSSAPTLRLERVGKNSVTHGCQSDSLCPMRSFRSIHDKKLKKNHTNVVVVSSWSVETPWLGT